MDTQTKEKEATPDNVEKALKEFKPNPALSSAASIMPRTFQAVMEMAKTYANSGLVPDALKNKPEACAVAIMHGLELGVSPSQAVNNIMVVNGRPTVWGDLMLALALGSNEMESFDEDAPDVALKQGFGRCTVKPQGNNNPVTRTFSIEDAKRAGLLSKTGPWQQYPGRMLMFRARSWALRDAIPHVLKGLLMREEVQDYDQPAAAPAPVAMPKRAALKEENTQEAEVIPNETAAAPETNNEVCGDMLVDDADRKELFKLRVEAKIGLAETKAYLMETFKVADTAQLTKAQAEVLKAWFRDINEC